MQKTIKLHEIIPDKLYQRGQFIKFPLNIKLRELRRFGITIIVNLCNNVDEDLKKSVKHYFHIPIPDSVMKNEKEILNAVNKVAGLIKNGERAIVHCNAGRNRSGLFNALLCMEILNISGEEAISRIRKCRANSLANENFVNFILNRKGISEGKMGSRKIIAIGGVPGTGKTTLMRKFMEQNNSWEQCSPAELLTAEYNKKLDLYVLGKYEEGDVFAGTDKLSMAVQPKIQKWIQSCDSNIIFEGDRIFNKSFFDFLLKEPEIQLLLIFLKSSQETLIKRYKQRGSNQSETFLKGRETKYNNIYKEAKLKRNSKEFIHETPKDTIKIIAAIKEFLANGEIKNYKPVEKSVGIRTFFNKKVLT